MRDNIKAVSILAELERAQLDYVPGRESEVRVVCPFHDDSTPSCDINIEKGLFNCHVCKAKGGAAKFFARHFETSIAVIWEDWKERYNLEDIKTIDPSAVEGWFDAIKSAGPLLQELYNRGITDEMIRKYRLGFNGHRITIPIRNESDLVVNIRAYLPGAPGSKKMQNKRGHGQARLFPISQLSYDTVIICGGELKAIATAERMNEKYGIGAISTTSGEGNWEDSFTPKFENKKVLVCLDVDKTGQKSAESLCARLKRTVKSIHKLDLPLSIDSYPHGDINDYFGAEKRSADDLMKLIEETAEWEPKKNHEAEDTSPVIDLTLADSSKAEYTGRRIRIKGNIAAIDTAPYVIPKTVKIVCDRSQEGCSMCPAFLEQPDKLDDTVTLHLHPESPAIVDMVGVPKNFQRESLMEGLKMPVCKVVEFRPTAYYNIEDVRLSPQLEITSRAVNDILLPALCVGHGLETNESYVLTGRMYPHPKTQQSILLISEVEASTDALSNYVPSEEELDSLKIFQPDEWTLEGVTSKLDSIYSDFEANVTRIFKRHPLHLIIDLTYHSTLFFKFDDKLTKGWVETLITGDSAQGKSETIIQMMDHYDLGERIECKNATVAGLLGGLQQLGKRWFVTWGVIPKHDKRIVFMEEIKGTTTEVLSKLTDMRSSGIAEIPKIEKRRTHARTRLVMVSNPRSDRPLSMYNFGIEAVKELIGSPEDIRRFDAVLLVSSQEVDAEELNQLQQFRPHVEHQYTKSKCHSLILWAWTRGPEQVKFTKDAEELILKSATRLCNEFTEVIPIVDRGSMRYKLSRLSIALACRTFSHSGECETVLVRRCHVEYIAEFLLKTYSDPIFGYSDFSKALTIHETLTNPELVKAGILKSPFPMDLIKQMLYTNEIMLLDIRDWSGLEAGEATSFLQLLVRKHALVRDQRYYRKTSQFIVFLKKLLTDSKILEFERPEHIKETVEF